MLLLIGVVEGQRAQCPRSHVVGWFEPRLTFCVPVCGCLAVSASPHVAQPWDPGGEKDLGF